MPYCVHCGVKLDDDAKRCPLCGTPVIDPNLVRESAAEPVFPTQAGEVKPVSRGEAALLITVILASVSAACGALNLFLRAEQVWSLYIIGAMAMLWLWFVPPLMDRKMGRFLRLLLDTAAIALYVLIIALVNHGLSWYKGLALPIVLTTGAAALFLALVLPGRSILSKTALLLGTAGGYALLLELLIDRFLTGEWEPGWSLVTVAICAAIIVPLIIVRRVPSLREEARRRFHI